MAIIQSDFAQAKRHAVVPDCAGDVATMVFDFTLPTSASTGDILEIGVLPSYCKLVDAVLISSASLTDVNVGLMSGAVGSTGVRTSGVEYFDGSALTANTPLRASIASAFGGVAAVEADRSIGVTLVDGSLSAGDVVTLVASYIS